MTEKNRLCMQCMLELDNRDNVCPYCGYVLNTKQQPPYLPMGTVIRERYLVGKMIKRNIDSAVYIGFDESAEKTIEIREFFPEKLSEREGETALITACEGYDDLFAEYLHSYVQLWKNLMRFKGLPALFDVNDVFELNGTAYAVTDHDESTTFRKILDTMNVEKSPFSVNRTKTLIMSILSTVESLHTANVVHRGISPETLILSSDGTLKITGFSISQIRTTKNKIISSVCDGYAAIEQYDFNWQQGSWTDIYSIGALIYKMLTGRTLPAAPSRLNDEEVYFTEEELERIPEDIIALIRGCLVLMPQGRMKDIHDIINVFSPREVSQKTVTAIRGSTVPRDIKKPAQAPAPMRALQGDGKLIEKESEPISREVEIVKPKQAVAATRTAVVKPPVTSNEEKLKEQRLSMERQRREEARRLKEQKKAEKRRNQKDIDPVKLSLIIGSAVSVTLIIFTFLLYGTVLYKYFDAPVLDNCLSHISFLPVNSQGDNDEVEYVEVADFKMLTKEYIEAEQHYKKRYNIVFEYEFCDTVEKGYVFRQSVESGQSVPIGSTITVYISKGIEFLTFIDVTGMQFDEAESKLTEIGFVVNKKESYNIGIYTQGKVISADLKVGDEYPRGTPVTLNVWSAPPVTLPSTTEPQPGTERPGGSGNNNSSGGFFSFWRDLFGFR